MGAILADLEYDFEHDENLTKSLPASSGKARLALGDDPERATEARPTLYVLQVAECLCLKWCFAVSWSVLTVSLEVCRMSESSRSATSPVSFCKSLGARNIGQMWASAWASWRKAKNKAASCTGRWWSTMLRTMKASRRLSWKTWRTSLYMESVPLKVTCCLEVMCLSIWSHSPRWLCAAESPQEFITKMSRQREKVSRVSMFRKLPGDEKPTRTNLEDGCACVHVWKCLESVLGVSL